MSDGPSMQEKNRPVSLPDTRKWSGIRIDQTSLVKELRGYFLNTGTRGWGAGSKLKCWIEILKERSQAKFVRTGNADMNVPMMKINTELGFRPYIGECIWQVHTDKVAENIFT